MTKQQRELAEQILKRQGYDDQAIKRILQLAKKEREAMENERKN